MKLNLKKPSPLKFAAQACNKSTITVCENSMQLRWGMEIRKGNGAKFTGYDNGVYIEYISYDGDPNVSTATLRLSGMIDAQLSNDMAITFHGDRGLNFHPDRKITGLNVIDKMIFWTDNHSEPKKINIERGKLGSLSSIYGAGFDGSDISPDPYTWFGVGTSCRGGLTMPDGSPSLACFSDFDQHTKLIVIDKHTMDCEKSTLDCDIFGCTDMSAINYNAAANTDDGSCIVPLSPVYGCDDGTYGTSNPNACNAGNDYWSLSGTYFNLLTGGGDGSGVGLTTPNTLDYNVNDSNLCIFHGTCELCDPATGNTIPDPNCGACIDTSLAADGSIAAINQNASSAFDCSSASGGTDYSCCQYCNDVTMLNYYSSPTNNDCSGVANGGDISCCDVPIIVIPDSWNCINGACIDPQTGLGQYSSLLSCQTNCVAPGVGCTASSATNYNASATVDDGSCEWTLSACNDCNYMDNYETVYDLVEGFTGNYANRNVAFQTIQSFSGVNSNPQSGNEWSYPNNWNADNQEYLQNLSHPVAPAYDGYGQISEGVTATDPYGGDHNTPGLPYNVMGDFGGWRFVQGGASIHRFTKLSWIGIKGLASGLSGQSYSMGGGNYTIGPSWDLSNPLIQIYYDLSQPGGGFTDAGGDFVSGDFPAGLYANNPNWTGTSSDPSTYPSLDWTVAGVATKLGTNYNSGSDRGWGTWSDTIKWLNAGLQECDTVPSCRGYLNISNAANASPDKVLQFSKYQSYKQVKRQIDVLLNKTKKPYSGDTFNLGPKTGMGGIDHSSYKASQAANLNDEWTNDPNASGTNNITWGLSQNVGIWHNNDKPKGTGPNSVPVTNANQHDEVQRGPYGLQFTNGESYAEIYVPYAHGPHLSFGVDACRCGTGGTYQSGYPIWCQADNVGGEGYCPGCLDIAGSCGGGGGPTI